MPEEIIMESVGKEGLGRGHHCALSSRDNTTISASILLSNLKNREFNLFLTAISSGQFDKTILDHNVGAQTLLQFSSQHGLDIAVDALLKKGADPNLAFDIGKQSPLILACIHRHPRTLDILLSSEKITVNSRDSEGNTALHYASRNHDLNSVLALLSYGADIKLKNLYGRPPIPADALEFFLNKNLSTNKQCLDSDNFELKFDYSIFTPRNSISKLENMSESCKRQEMRSEMDMLKYISNSDVHRRLLRHPVVSSFLYLKWNRVQIFFKTSLLFYTIFVIMINVSILFTVEITPFKDYVALATSVMCILLVLWNFLLILILGDRITSLKTIADVLIVAFMFFILHCGLGNEIVTPFKVAAILFSWMRLFLLFGQHPKLAENIQIFKTVSKNYFWFLLPYSFVIFAFAFTFHVLFYDPTQNNLFQKPVTSFFRTTIMVTGEYEANDLFFEQYPITSHVVFVLFIFLTTIVMLNLLTGLAVSDIQAIKENAEILTFKSRVRLVAKFEKFFLQYFRFVARKLNLLRLSSILLFPANQKDKQIIVYPNKNNKIEFPFREGRGNYVMDAGIVSDALNLISGVRNANGISEIYKELKEIKKSLGNLEKVLQKQRGQQDMSDKTDGEVNLKTGVHDTNECSKNAQIYIDLQTETNNRINEVLKMLSK